MLVASMSDVAAVAAQDNEQKQRRTHGKNMCTLNKGQDEDELTYHRSMNYISMSQLGFTDIRREGAKTAKMKCLVIRIQESSNS
jgi:hypothetical protein